MSRSRRYMSSRCWRSLKICKSGCPCHECIGGALLRKEPLPDIGRFEIEPDEYGLDEFEFWIVDDSSYADSPPVLVWSDSAAEELEADV